MTYSELKSEADSNFAINSLSEFDSDSDPDSHSDYDSHSDSMNLLIFVFFILYLHSPK